MIGTLLAVALSCADPSAVSAISADPSFVVGDLPVTIELVARTSEGDVAADFCGTAEIRGTSGSTPVSVAFENGRGTLRDILIRESVSATAGNTAHVIDIHRVPGFLSVVPPLFAILLAIVSRQALIALFGGIWLGAFFIHGYRPLEALLATFDTYVIRVVASSDHAAIILFTLGLGGIVGLLSKSGATRSLVNLVARRTQTRRSGMLTAWGSGLLIFFDDYANCLLVGNTVRPFTDRLRISREKLAYIIDSTAAPIATVAIISTWVGFQIGLFDALAKGDPTGEFAGINGYSLFLSIIPYCFYSLFTIAFVFILAWTGRDFGPMLRAETRTLQTGAPFRDGATPMVDADFDRTVSETSGAAPWWVAAVSIGSVILIVLLGLYATGLRSVSEGAGLRDIIAAADPYAVLMWAAFGGSLLSLAIVVGGGWLGFNEASDSWVSGIKAMTLAIIVLILAWTIGELCKSELQTGRWLLSQLAPSARALPALTFVGAGLVALSTGSSYSTMAIMTPIAAPMAWSLTGDGSGFSPDVVESIRYATLAAVLSGSVFGDHCSPISDTTIMSSMAAASDHVDHVRTQMPYAVTVAIVAIAIGYIPAGYGLSPWLMTPLALALLLGIIRFLGRHPEPSAS